MSKDIIGQAFFNRISLEDNPAMRSTRKNPHIKLKIILLLVLAISCGGTLTKSSAGAELRVLFIGNSLTYTNDIPAIVQALAEAAGKRRFVYKMIALPDFSLEDHWDQGDARRAIKDGKWDVVVLQQGPSALPESRALLIEYARRFNDEIRKIGARPALFTVWPSRARFNDFNRVVESYALAAQAVDGMLLPAGAAWQAAWRYKPELALYSPDNFHPSIAGSYLAAIVIYQQLYGDNETQAPSKLKLRSKTVSKIELSEGETQLLNKAAREVVAKIEPR
jgi:hypothetical protein